MKNTIKRILVMLLAVLLVFPAFPSVQGAATHFELPSSCKVFHLDGKSTNSKTEAEYLAIDGNMVYVLFMRRQDKELVSGTMSMPGVKDPLKLSFSEEHYSYETVTVEGNTLVPKSSSDKKYVWQIATCNLSGYGTNGDVIISAQATAGGFSLNNVHYTLDVTYGLLATKEVISVNDVPVTGDPMVDIGDTIMWHVTIENVGDFPVTGITVEDKLEGAWLSEQDAFTLAPNEKKVIKAWYVVKPEDAGTKVINVIAASSSGGMVEAGTSNESIISYTVTYDANGGVDAPDLQNKEHDVTIPLHENVPQREGYEFIGWNTEPDGSGIPYEPGVDYSDNTNLKLYAQWKDLNYTVVFHANNPDYTGEDVFRTYHKYEEMPYMLNEDNTVTSFYDIPQFEYLTHNKYIFRGWYLDQDNTNNSRPISWTDTYTQETHIYAHWIETGTVVQEDDGKKNIENNTYKGFDLVGVQIRTIEKDSVEHYGEMGSGLRFLCVLSEEVWSQIKTTHSSNEAAAEYGVLLCKESTAQNYITEENHQMKYRGTSVNGENTKDAYAYLKNVKCSGVPDHFEGVAYRLYTAVVTYKNMEQAALEQAQASALIARAYIGYYDANGLYRYHYNNYTGTEYYHGCRASYAETYAQLVPTE